MKNKIFDVFIAIILAGMFVSVAYLINLYKSKKQYDNFMSVLYEIENINFKINSTVFGEKKIYNFDRINNELNLIKNDIEKLKNTTFYNSYKTEIDLLENKFNKKMKLVERFNSYNAINISTIIYLLDISEDIKKHVTNDEKIDEAIYKLFKIYLGIEDKKTEFITDNRYLKPYFEYVNSVMEKLKEINKIREKIKTTSFESAVENLFNDFKLKNKQIDKEFNSYIYFIGGVDLALFIILLFLQIRIYVIRKKLYEFKIAIDKSNNSVLFLNKKGFIYYVNESFEKNSGYKKEELINKHLSYYLKKALGEKGEYKEILESLENDRKFSKILTLKNKNNETLYEKVLLYPVYYEGKFSNYVFLKLNITEEIKRERKIEYIAYHDSFTGLFNRKRLVEDLKNLIEQKEDFYLILMDINKFKYINDAFSHSVGDKILLSIAEILKSINKEYTYRTTGDEFALIVFDDYEKIADDLINRCKKIEVDGQNFKIDISMGIVRSEFKNLSEILKFADIALNESKRIQSGLVLFNDELYRKYMRKTQIAALLPKAIDDNEFYVVYQPKIDIKKHTVYSLEALVRWKNSDLGEIYPDEFIPAAEERNYIEKIDRFVLKQASKDIKELKKIYPQLENISVNLSGMELVKEDLDKKIIDLIKKENTNPKYIEFEVTETYLILNIENCAKILKNLKKQGSKISIDDFGTGYSSLYYLSSLPFDTIKIDKKFVDNINENKELIKIIVSLAKTFDLDIVAEGVETKEQEQILYELGIHNIQGYLYSKPLQKEQLIEFLKNF